MVSSQRAVGSPHSEWWSPGLPALRESRPSQELVASLRSSLLLGWHWALLCISVVFGQRQEDRPLGRFLELLLCATPSFWYPLPQSNMPHPQVQSLLSWVKLLCLGSLPCTLSEQGPSLKHSWLCSHLKPFSSLRSHTPSCPLSSVRKGLLPVLGSLLYLLKVGV